MPGGATATSVDALVEGVHFRRDLASLAQIGHKALATALSDLAAMGAEAGEAYVVLGVPTDLDEDGCIELLDGMLALAAATGTTLAGGDISRAGELFLAITVVGHAPSPDALRRTRRGAARATPWSSPARSAARRRVSCCSNSPGSPWRCRRERPSACALASSNRRLGSGPAGRWPRPERRR